MTSIYDEMDPIEREGYDAVKEHGLNIENPKTTWPLRKKWYYGYAVAAYEILHKGKKS